MFGRGRQQDLGRRDPRNCGGTCGALYDHVRDFFAGRDLEVFVWAAGPMQRHNPHFRVVRVAPSRPGDVWTYVSIGGWAEVEEGPGLEFVLCTPAADVRAVELLAMAAYVNRGGTLGIGHTVSIGRPWLPESPCGHLLVSLPYPFGEQLRTAYPKDRHVEFLWLLPITEAERAFKVAHGLEALESRFDEAGLRYWQIDRDSVV
ncbi:MAG: suppressor of fused domain protein [Sporichthyaceae bacterium]